LKKIWFIILAITICVSGKTHAQYFFLYDELNLNDFVFNSLVFPSVIKNDKEVLKVNRVKSVTQILGNNDTVSTLYLNTEGEPDSIRSFEYPFSRTVKFLKQDDGMIISERIGIAYSDSVHFYNDQEIIIKNIAADSVLVIDNRLEKRKYFFAYCPALLLNGTKKSFVKLKANDSNYRKEIEVNTDGCGHLLTMVSKLSTFNCKLSITDSEIFFLRKHRDPEIYILNEGRITNILKYNFNEEIKYDENNLIKSTETKGKIQKKSTLIFFHYDYY